MFYVLSKTWAFRCEALAMTRRGTSLYNEQEYLRLKDAVMRFIPATVMFK